MRFALVAFTPLALLITSSAALSAEPERPADNVEPAERAPEAGEEDDDAAVEAEEKRICRYIRTDMNSRRKEKVCLTKEGWRELNNRR